MFGPDSNSPLAYSWLAAIALGGIASWSLYRFVESIRRDRVLADTPLVKIRSAAQGYVKIAGHAKAAGDQPIAAPLSARPCVWWSYELAEKTTNYKGETRWRTIDSGTSIAPFVLEDTDAECLVGPINAEITPTSHDVWFGDRPSPGCLPAHNKGLLDRENYRYDERLLSVGAFLSVVGELRSISEIETVGAATGALLHRWKQDQKTLLARFDRNHDGHIDSAEWDAVRRAAEADAQDGALSSRIARSNVIGQSTHGQPFIIAAMDSPHLVRREKYKALMFLGLGLVCIVLCAGIVERTWAPAPPNPLISGRCDPCSPGT